jgi:hypothetical protein
MEPVEHEGGLCSMGECPLRGCWTQRGGRPGRGKPGKGDYKMTQSIAISECPKDKLPKVIFGYVDSDGDIWNHQGDDPFLRWGDDGYGVTVTELMIYELGECGYDVTLIPNPQFISPATFAAHLNAIDEAYDGSYVTADNFHCGFKPKRDGQKTADRYPPVYYSNLGWVHQAPFVVIAKLRDPQ